MRRRTVVEKHPPPNKLATYRSEQWEGDSESERMSAWNAARREWGDALDLDVIPGQEHVHIPDEPWNPELI